MIPSILLSAAITAAATPPAGDAAAFLDSFQVAARASCKSYSSCRQAVTAWCAGHHPGADRDNDGIPCETSASPDRR